MTALLGALAWNAHARFDNAPNANQPDNPIDQATANAAREHGAPKVLQGPLRWLSRRPLSERDADAGTA